MTFESLLYVFLKVKENVFTVWIHSMLIINTIHKVGFAWVFRIHESETQPLYLFHEIVIPGRVRHWEITKWRTCNTANTISLKIQIIRKSYLVLKPYLHEKYEQYALEWKFPGWNWDLRFNWFFTIQKQCFYWLSYSLLV